jgi:hypothetical protein
MWKKIWFALLIFSFLATACNLPGEVEVSPEPELPEGATANLALHAETLRLEPDAVIYSLFIVNLGNDPVGDVSLELQTENEGVALEVSGTYPLHQVNVNLDLVAWEIEEVPAHSLLGPFAVRALGPQAAGVQASLRWASLSSGERTITIDTIEDATQTSVEVEMNSVSMSEVPHNGLYYGVGGDYTLYMPIESSAGATSSTLFTQIPDSGVQYYVPEGSRGMVTIKRLDSDPDSEAFNDWAPLAAYQVTKENPGSLLLTVPLSQPAVPYSLVRVFVDSGEGYQETAMLGTVTADGMHAIFSADHESEYILTVSRSSVGSGSGISLRGGGVDQEFDDLAGDLDQSLEDVNSQVFDSVVGQSIGLAVTGAISQYAANTSTEMMDEETLALFMAWQNYNLFDNDGDGMENDLELASGTDPNDPDSDDDGYDDLHEVASGSDPNNPQDTPSSGDDGVVIAPGCTTMFCMVDRESDSGDGSGGGGFPSVDNLTGTSSFNEGWDLNMNANIPTSASDLITIWDALSDSFGDAVNTGGSTQVQGPDTIVIRTVIALAPNRLLLLIPGGQMGRPVLGLTPYLASLGWQLPGGETLTEGEGPPTETTTPTTNAQGITLVPATDTSQPPTSAPPKADTSGPKVGGVSASPDTVFTSGNKPDTLTVSANVNDPSGVAGVVLYYRMGKGNFVAWGNLTPAGGSTFSILFGPFGTAGVVEFRIWAIDSLGNANCDANNPGSCPGGTVTVTIP